jgi:hypothetical protein
MLIPTDYNSHFSFPELAMFFLPQSFMFISDTIPNGQLGSVGATGHVELRDDWRDHGREPRSPIKGLGAAMPQNTIISGYVLATGCGGRFAARTVRHGEQPSIPPMVTSPERT